MLIEFYLFLIYYFDYALEGTLFLAECLGVQLNYFF